MEQNTDHLLAQRAAAGDTAARDQLLARHYRAIRRLCRRLCPDSTTADDVLQETLIAVLRNLGSYRGDASFTTWVYTVARTHYGRTLRTDQRHRARADRLAALVVSVPDAGAGQDDALAASELRDRVQRALECLGPLDRAVLESRDFLGCSAAETARELSLTIPAVKTRLHRARARVRAMLEPPTLVFAA
ncbi:MAG: RNA polymerase sigma factor [Nannocystaceae bacterium]|nr:sigma-70 family RNA polymerase sigma factor [bacterium]